jgi:predicted transposase YbfD/YdcC
MTYCNVLARVDAKHLDEILQAFFVRWEAEQRCGAEPSRLHTPHGQADHAHLAIDGKTLRATTSQPHPVHQLSCYEVATGIVLWHCNVEEKENEMSALKPLLTPQLITGRIFTLDAMHTRAPRCVRRSIGSRETIFWLPRTINQRSTKILPICLRIAPLIVVAGNKQRPGTRGHGRLEHRQIICSPDLNDWFGKQWEGIAQVFRLERTRHILKTGAIEHEVIYGLSSLSMRQASPARMLSLVRDHWAIENKLHYRRDGSLGEDACQTRTGPVPGLLAQLNSRGRAKIPAKLAHSA